MPTYRTPVHGISLSEALAEAAAAAPVTRVMLTCLELSHPSLPAPIRLVADTDDVTVTHEAGAPIDPSSTATYLAAPITVGVPEQSPGAGSPEIQVTIGHVNGQVRLALEASRATRTPWTIVERQYASDDLTGPAVLPPLSLYVTSVDLQGDHTAVLRCSHGNPQVRAVPRLTFRSTEYSGLAAR